MGYALASLDFEWTADFYGRLFGWQFQPADNECLMFQTPGGGGGGFRKDSAPGADGVFYIYCHSVHDKLSEVAAAGGTVVMEETPLPGRGWAGMFMDLDGNTIGLFSGENPPPAATSSGCSCGH